MQVCRTTLFSQRLWVRHTQHSSVCPSYFSIWKHYGTIFHFSTKQWELSMCWIYTNVAALSQVCVEYNATVHVGECQTVEGTVTVFHRDVSTHLTFTFEKHRWDQFSLFHQDSKQWQYWINTFVAILCIVLAFQTCYGTILPRTVMMILIHYYCSTLITTVGQVPVWRMESIWIQQCASVVPTKHEMTLIWTIWFIKGLAWSGFMDSFLWANGGSDRRGKKIQNWNNSPAAQLLRRLRITCFKNASQPQFYA